ncbi:MAG: hypothetical protein EXX96DRAFT_588166 [Benjaminiella poitrasii]|nr:MAG: hypothetical protein EXX96DRAFT_588166 [Benjaminiella poitrasii]
MQNKLCFEVVDLSLQDLRCNDQLFGGISIVFGGDFAQFPLVAKNASRSQIADSSI